MADIDIRAQEIKLVPIGDIKPNPKNRNIHSDEQISRLADIIKYQGFRSPLIISNQTGLLISGHGRLEAAKRLGLKMIPVLFQDFDDQDQEYAAGISENSIAAWAELDLAGINVDVGDLGPDFELNMLGLRDFTLDLVEKIEPQCDEDEVPEVQAESKVVLGDVFTLGRHRMMCGDSTSIDDVEKLMNGEKADMVFTDPPYGIDVVGGGKAFGSVVGGNTVPANEYSTIIGDDTTETAKEFYQTCQAIGVVNFVLWGGNYFTDFLPPKKCWVVWDKKGRQWDDNYSDFEMAWTSFDKPAKILTHVWMGMVQSGQREQRVHPTQKPSELVSACIEYLNASTKSVYDGFGGSGSTLIACEKTNRTCFMMELSPQYCAVILDRWSKFVGGDPIRSDGVKWSEIKATV